MKRFKHTLENEDKYAMQVMYEYFPYLKNIYLEIVRLTNLSVFSSNVFNTIGNNTFNLAYNILENVYDLSEDENMLARENLLVYLENQDFTIENLMNHMDKEV